MPHRTLATTSANPPHARHPVSTRLLLAGMALSLGGCAMAPGMYVGQQGTGEALKRTTLLSVLKRPVEPVSVAGPADAPPPPGTITPITSALIQQQRAARRDEVPAEVQALFAAPKIYAIGAGDVLNIVVWDHPELAITPAGGLGTDVGSLSGVGNGYNVSPQGLIQFPYVGTVKLAGLNEYEARDLITERLSKYIKHPQVTVRIQSYRSGRVYLDGEIRNPGLQALNEIPMTLPEAIGRAGGFTPAADRAAIALSRNGQTTLINLAQLTEHGINPSRILLAHGDMVRVLGREEAKVFVLGEVLRPNSQPLRNGRLTLNEALSDSGGINPTSADPRQIFVVRTQNPEKPEIFHLDAKSPVAYALAEGFELKARDVVYVDPVPLVRWNRVISLILPSAQAVNVTRDATAAK